MTTPNLSSPPASTQIRRSGRLIFVGLLALCLLFAIGYVQRSSDKAAVEAEIRALEAQIAQARQQQAVLQDELKTIEQPNAIDAAARNDLGLVQPGDQPIVVLVPPATATSAPVALPPAQPAAQWDWQRWLEDLWPAGEQ
ncbi:MAG: septum formation initiator family protein [Tetrasphaera sp.]